MANLSNINVNGTNYSVYDSSAVHTVDSALSSTSKNPVQNNVINTALSNKETTSNKVTSLTTSSTNTQYPSAKCVYDETKALRDAIADLQSDTVVYRGTCATAGADFAKVVTCPAFTSSSLVTGAVIYVTFDNTNSGAVANLTLNVNNTGAKNIRYLVNTTLNTLPSAGYILANISYRFCYNGTYWIMDLQYNTDSSAYLICDYYMNRHASQTISPYSIILVDLTNEFSPYTTATGVTTYTKAPITTAFNPFAGIYWKSANNTTNAGAKLSNGSVYSAYTGNYIDVRYSFNINASGTAGTTALTADKPVYIKARYDFATGLAYLVGDTTSSNYLTRSSIVQELPGTNPNTDGNFYIYIYFGNAYDKYRAVLNLQNPVYAWNSISGAIAPFTGARYSGYGTFSANYNAVYNTWHYYKEGQNVTVWGTISQATSLNPAPVLGLPFAAYGNQVVSATCRGGTQIVTSLSMFLTDGATTFTPCQMTSSSTSGSAVTVLNSSTMIWYTIGNSTELRFTYLTSE